MVKIKLLILLLGVLLPQLSFAAQERSSQGVIKRLITYANYGNGDVFISLENNGTVCRYGYFVNQDSLGYQSTLSGLLAAYQAQTPIFIYGFTDSGRRSPCVRIVVTP